MSPEPKRILAILASWVAAGMDADTILERVCIENGPVAHELRRWVARRGGVPIDAHDPGAPRAAADVDTKPIDVSDLPDPEPLDLDALDWDEGHPPSFPWEDGD